RLPEAYGRSQPPPIVPQRAYDPAFRTSTPRNTYVPVEESTITFTPYGGSAPVTLPLHPKAIVADFDPEYGRLTYLLGTELPKTSALLQTTIPLTRIDPPTEVVFPSDPAVPVGAPGDGTQLWKITHSGTDTLAVHFHHVNVQLVNRVGRDGAIRPPEPNELGWKETVRMNPYEDTIVALRPTLPAPLPFKVSDSVRLHDPTQLPGMSHGCTQVNPRTGEPAMVTNRLHNFGWEYVWHGQPLGHADQQMTRPLVLHFSPAAPTGLTARPSPGSASVLPAIVVTWTNNARGPAVGGTTTAGSPAASNSLVQRATDAAFSHGLTSFVVPATAGAHTDSTVTPGLTYYYRVRAENNVAHSAYSNTASAVVHLVAPTGLVASVAPGPPLRVNRVWTNRSFATTVDLQRATNPTFTSGLVTTIIPVAGSCPDAPVAADTTYYYRVRTSYLGASSPWSNVCTVVTPAAPAAPVNLVAVNHTAASGPGSATVTLTWSIAATSTVTGFALQRATSPGFGGGLTTFAVSGAGRSMNDAGLARDTVYHYRIQATNAAGSSAFSRPVSIRTPA
ncbi:hypothetical protein ACQEUR_21855, partial [Plantactinospora sp. CA-290183]